MDKNAIKGQFIFSPIFEKEEECKNAPFVFEKFELQNKTPADYPDKTIQGPLLRMKKKKQVRLPILIARKQARAAMSPRPSSRRSSTCSTNTASSSSP